MSLGGSKINWSSLLSMFFSSIERDALDFPEVRDLEGTVIDDFCNICVYVITSQYVASSNRHSHHKTHKFVNIKIFSPVPECQI